MLRRLKAKLDIFVIIAFLLPFIFYGGVFLGRSFGLECAAGIMGSKPLYQQQVTVPNAYCLNISDVGAYAWQGVPQSIKVAVSYLNFRWPLWNQNNGIGVPLAANFISTAYFIPNILFAIPKSVLAFDFYFIFRMSIVSLGMYLFLRSFKIPRPACLIGSLIVFLNGYVTYIPTISHLDVDILLPWIALLINKSFSTKKIKYFVLLSLVTALSHLGGMPEASVFIALFFGVYVTFLSFLVAQKTDRLKFITFFLGSLFFSFLIASILIIPGYEYITQGSSYHHPGIQQATSVDFRNIIFWPFPRLFGLINESSSKFQPHVGFGIWALEYIGAAAFFLLISSISLILFQWKELQKFPLKKYFLFFFFFLSILLSQYFGLFQNPIFTKLPGFSQTNFPKYSLTLINFLIATNAVFVLYYLIKKRIPFISILSALFMVIFTAVTYFYFKTAAVSAGMYSHFVKQLLFSSGIVLLLCSLIVLKDKLLIKKSFVYGFILVLAMVEFYVYIPSRGDLQRRDSFQKPPAIDFLKSKDYKSSRIFSPDYIIYPDLSSIFDINDIRNLDAIWPKDYYDYLGYFIVPELDKAAMRFTGLKENGTTTDAKYVNNVFFDLTSTKYILSFKDIRGYEDIQRIEPYLKQIQQSPSLRSEVFTIGGIARSVLFQHPNSKITLTVEKPKGATYFYLYPALSEEVFNDPKKGDGVHFSATVSTKESILFNQMLDIDSKNKKEDQKWFEMAFGPFPQDTKKFDLTLETNSVKSPIWDFSGWGGFEWDTNKSSITDYQFKKIYDAEMQIFENTHFVPRLHPISQVVCAGNENEVVDQMRKMEPVIRDSGVVLSSNCQNKTYETANIALDKQQFQDQKVSFVYSSPHESYIILSNDFYPGWKLKINNKEYPIDCVNFTFQGLHLPAGKNMQVEIIYDPLSFKLGLSLSLFSLTVCLIMLKKYRNETI